jgi:hypothetical protein
MRIKILLGLTFISINQLHAQGVVSDDFNGASINAGLWNVTLPYGDSSVTEGGGVVSIENNGRLTTQTASPSSYSISGSFLMANNPYSNFKIVLRTDGTPDASEAKGIAFQFNIQNDPAGGGSTKDNLRIFSIGDSGGDFTTPEATANLTLNTWNTFLITDDGNNLALYFDGASTPTVSAQSTFSAGNLVTFYNREGNGGGSSISDGGITELDYINITPAPEPSTVSLFGLSILGILFKRLKS